MAQDTAQAKQDGARRGARAQAKPRQAQDGARRKQGRKLGARRKTWRKLGARRTQAKQAKQGARRGRKKGAPFTARL